MHVSEDMKVCLTLAAVDVETSQVNDIVITTSICHCEMNTFQLPHRVTAESVPSTLHAHIHIHHY